MVLTIILGLAAGFALYWTMKTKKTFPAIITVGMIVGIIVVLFAPATMQAIGFYIYMAFVVLAFVYGLIEKEKKIGDRIIIGLMSASIFTYWLWVLNHWHGNTILFPIITLLVVVTGIFTKPKLKNELGFLTILVADAIVIIIENWMKMS